MVKRKKAKRKRVTERKKAKMEKRTVLVDWEGDGLTRISLNAIKSGSIVLVSGRDE